MIYNFKITCIVMTAMHLFACNQINTEQMDSSGNTTLETVNTAVVEDGVDDITEEYDSFYVVIADTGKDYFLLRSEMVRLSEKLNTSIDTMGRYFNASKNLIALPEDDEDEMYAGNYFPRRFPSESLSLEYISYYLNQSDETTIGLVVGIYDEAKAADSTLQILKKITGRGFKVKAGIYLGCMH